MRGKISEAFNICVYGRNNNRMNKQRVAAVLCASMVLTASPVNGLALTVEASENEAENNTESSGETKENETEEPEVTENPVSPEENQKEVSSSDKEGEKTDSGEKEENSPKQEKNTDSGGDATEETDSSESTRDVAEDIQFIGFKCKYDQAATIPHKSWVDITAELHYEFAKEYRGKGPVLYAIDVKKVDAPEEELVYF